MTEIDKATLDCDSMSLTVCNIFIKWFVSYFRKVVQKVSFWSVHQPEALFSVQIYFTFEDYLCP
jgi:hypothetical protein